MGASVWYRIEVLEMNGCVHELFRVKEVGL